jgi:outer membrane lipoprotein carrier protein
VNRHGGLLASAVALALAATVATRAIAACPATGQCLREIEEANRDLRAIAARVVQTKHLSLLTEPLLSQGRLVFSRPDRLLWVVETPRELRIAIEGERIEVADVPAEARDALAAVPQNELLRRLGAIFAGELGALTDGFELTTEDGADVIRVSLVPREARLRESIDTIELHYVRPKLTIRTIRLRNRLGDLLEIQLDDLERNPTITPSTFE